MARLKLLGAVVCEDDGERLERLSARQHPIAILALLARASSRTISRGKLVGHLWPETPEQTARSRLSTHVHEIRRELADEVLLSEGDDLRLNRDLLSCDVWQFEEALQAEAWDRAVELYRGPFLDGFRLKGSPAFEKWMDAERAELRRAHREALEALAEEAAERGEPVAAARWWRRRAEEDPYDSRVVVQLMDALVAAGNPGKALRVARVHGRLLADELGTEPSAEVRKRAERIEVGATDVSPGEATETAGTRPAREGEPAPDGDPTPPAGDRHEEAPTAGRDVDLEPEDAGAPGRSTPLGRLSAVAILLLTAAIFVWYLTTGGRESPEIGERTVAVLPFQVSGSGTDTWRDGMVSLLSANLDGAAGLRTVADRTVFAALEKEGYEAEATSTEQALEVARQVGARYAVVGSASRLGEELRLTARLYETHSGARLNRVEVSGTEKGVTSLADSLTREMLGVLLEESGEHLPSVDLASITTRSLPALKRYLAGERHLRAGEYEAAIKDYEAAVEADSTFALAYLRLGRANGWALNSEARDRNVERAYRLSDRLPERERGWAQAAYWWEVEDRVRTAVDTLRRLTDAYPDDPILWYSLGEVLWHGFVPGGWPEADRAFERAIELDPGHAIYHPHLVQLAISVHDDSALAAERIEAVPREEWKAHMQIARDLAYGSQETRRRALARLDTVPRSTFWRLGPWHALRPPVHGGAHQQMLRKLWVWEERGRSARALTVRTQLDQGQIEKAVANLRDFDGSLLGSALLSRAMSVGIPVPDSLAHSYLAPSVLPDDPVPLRWLLAGRYLIDQGRGAEIETIIERLRSADVSGRRLERWIAQLRGYRAWKAGKLKQAESLWRGWTTSNVYGAIWRGDLYRDLGEPKKAEGWYRAAWPHPLAHDRLGRLLESRDEPREAAAAYRRFIAAWEDADPRLQPRVEEARKRLRQLAGAAR